MIKTNATGARRDEDVPAALVTARWLHFAAAPTFVIMALLTVVSDIDAPGVLCSAASGATLNGMAPMYLLMAAFHLGPWLKLISRRRSLASLPDLAPSDSFPVSGSF